MSDFEPNVDYLCGLIDARGWFYCFKQSRQDINPNGCGFHFVHYFVLETYDGKLCKTLQDFFRVGKIKKFKSKRVDLTKYYWRIMSDDLVSFITQVYPHCVYLREMMDVILLFRNTFPDVPRGTPLPDSVVEERSVLIAKYKEIQKLTPWNSRRV